MPGTHPDWQQIVEWDGPALVSGTLTSGTPTAILPVGMWESVAYRYRPGLVAGNAFLTLVWYADQAGTLQMGSVVIALDNSSGQAIGQYRVQNRGPYLKIQISSANATSSFQAIPTNRRYANPTQQPGAMLMWVNQVIGAGNSFTQFYTQGGPQGDAIIWLFASAAGVVESFNVLDINGVYRQVSGVDVTGAPPAQFSQRRLVGLPPDSWQWQLINQGAAAATVTGGIMLTGSVTG